MLGAAPAVGARPGRRARSGLPATGLASTPGVSVVDFDRDGVADVAACSGLKVESTTGGPRAPLIASRILVWRGQRPPAPKTPDNIDAGE